MPCIKRMSKAHHQPSPAVDKVADLATRSKLIDGLLEKERQEEAKVTKILLLGGGESGKSTFLKQIRLLHMNGFTEDDYGFYRNLIYLNVLDNVAAILQAMERFHIPMHNHQNKENVPTFYMYYYQAKAQEGHVGYYKQIDSTLSSIVQGLWQDLAVQECYARRSEYHVIDSTKYYLDQIERIFADQYKPTVDDILRSRFETTGINEILFTYRSVTIKMIDVGGQKSMRRKWIHCFDNVTAILFISSMIEYDMILMEDSQTNRMSDSLQLFEEISNNPIFHATSVMLFLNKIDLFGEKICRVPLSRFYPELEEMNCDWGDFIKWQFLKRAPPNKEIYAYFTCATDTNNIDCVFQTVIDIIVKRNVAKAGLI